MLADGTGAGEDALFHAHNEHPRELQALGRVHGHHDHAILVVVRVVQVGVQRHLVQEPVQRRLLRLLQVVLNGGAQLLGILDAGAVLHGVLGLEGSDVAGILQRFLVEIGQLHGGRLLLEGLDEGEELV